MPRFDEATVLLTVEGAGAMPPQVSVRVDDLDDVLFVLVELQRRWQLKEAVRVMEAGIVRTTKDMEPLAEAFRAGLEASIRETFGG